MIEAESFLLGVFATLFTIGIACAYTLFMFKLDGIANAIDRNNTTSGITGIAPFLATPSLPRLSLESVANIVNHIKRTQNPTQAIQATTNPTQVIQATTNPTQVIQATTNPIQDATNHVPTNA